MLRFTSSPTSDMYLENLRVALLNYIVAQQKNEDLIVRIEDIDQEKSIEGKDKDIIEILALFGIQYSQIIYQSQNIRFHSAMALQLLHEKKAFSCFCSTEWLENKKQEAKELNETYQYDDACRNLPAELVIDNTSPFTIRITRPDTEMSISENVDSFVIMNQDKTPTYDFSCAVDDMLSDISTVIYSEKYINSTFKQAHIRKSLSYEKTIEYIQVPSLLCDDTFSVEGLLEEGYVPDAISNYLISIGTNLPSEIFTLKEAIAWFDIKALSNSSIHFDIKMLKHINKEHLKIMDAKELSRYVGFADEEIGKLARIYLEEADTTKELKAKISPIFEPRIIPEEFVAQAKMIVSAIKSAPYFEEYNDFKNYILKETGLEEKDYAKPMRLLLTNAEQGPDISKVYKYIKNYLGEIIK